MHPNIEIDAVNTNKSLIYLKMFHVFQSIITHSSGQMSAHMSADHIEINMVEPGQLIACKKRVGYDRKSFFGMLFNV